MEYSSIHRMVAHDVDALKREMGRINDNLLMIEYYQSKYFREYVAKHHPLADAEQLAKTTISETILPKLENAIESFNSAVISLHRIGYDRETNTITKEDN